MKLPSSRWLAMFGDALRGTRMAMLGERSFRVHVPAAAAVIAAGFFFRVSQVEWLVLVLCITLVISLELMNTALERMAKAITRERNVHIGAALDIGAAAVLAASLGAVVCGLVIFVPHALDWWFGSGS
jgi:diacylglycerol kinase